MYNRFDAFVCGNVQGFEYRVSEHLVLRAKVFLANLIKAFADHGHRVVRINDGWQRGVHISIHGELCQIHLRERAVEGSEPPPKGERQKPLIGTDELVLKLTDFGLGKEFKDQQRKKLEERVDEIVLAEVKRVEDFQRVQREREASIKDRERRLVELKQKQDAERAKLEGLLREAESFKRSQLIREYVAAVKSAMLQRHGSIEPGSELQRWIEWATQQADRFDPLGPKTPSVLDETIL